MATFDFTVNISYSTYWIKMETAMVTENVLASSNQNTPWDCPW